MLQRSLAEHALDCLAGTAWRGRERADCEPEDEHFNTKGIIGHQLGKRGFLRWWSGLVLLVHTSGTRSGQRGKAPMAHFDPQTCHRKPHLSPDPRPPSTAAQYRDSSSSTTARACLSSQHTVRERIKPKLSGVRGLFVLLVAHNNRLGHRWWRGLFFVTRYTLHRAPVGQRRPRVLIGWPLPLGFGLGGCLLLARRGRVCV